MELNVNNFGLQQGKITRNRLGAVCDEGLRTSTAWSQMALTNLLSRFLINVFEIEGNEPFRMSLRLTKKYRGRACGN